MPRSPDDLTPRRPAWFWWALANLLALCFAVLSWTLALEVFGRPDVPRNYQILRKLERAPEFKRYNAKSAPEGRLLDPAGVYGWFFQMGEERYGLLNSLYRRNFMRNFDGAHAVTYIEGEFEVLATRPFNGKDFLPHGFAVRAKAMVRPDDFSKAAPYPVIIELMVPTKDESARAVFAPGLRFSLGRAPHFPVVMHVGRHLEGDESVVQVTVMPIGYGSWQVTAHKAVALEVPEWVEPEGALPLFAPGRAAGSAP